MCESVLRKSVMRYVKYRSRLQQHPVMVPQLCYTKHRIVNCMQLSLRNPANIIIGLKKNSVQSIWAHAVLIALATDITDALFDNGFVTLQVDVHKFLIEQ